MSGSRHLKPVPSIRSTLVRSSNNSSYEDLPSQANTQQDLISLCEEEEEEETSGQGKKRKFTSLVWNHFKNRVIEGEEKAICNYCDKQLGAKGKNETKHLHDHMKRCPCRNKKNINQAILNPVKGANERVSSGTYSFDQVNARMELGSMIILHEYPLSMVDDIGFRRFTNTLQPLFKNVSCNNIKNDILTIYNYEKEKVMRLLEKYNGKIAITIDMWASNQKKGFMAITAHFIDEAWKLQSRILRFKYVSCLHTSEALSTSLMDCLLDWNIDRKLSTLTDDNCTTNDVMINILLDKLSSSSLLLNGEFFHVGCCAHILNLIVKDGLEIINSSVEKIRDSIAYWTATPKRVEKFETFARQLKISCSKKLALNCKTRWTSTYLMLHSAVQYRLVFSLLKQRESQYRCLPTDKDWELAKEICEKLEVFFDVTRIFSGTKYPTSNLYFSNICDIKLSIYDLMKSPYEEIKMMASSMIDKFEKYWSETHGILAVASVLDPRFKMKLVEYYFPMIYGNEVSDLEIEKIRKFCQKLLNEYKTRHGSSGNVSQSSNQIEASTSKSKKDRLTRFALFVSNATSTVNKKSELDIFLDEPLFPTSNDFDILAWWNANSTRYPFLQKVARDILAISVSTVASESVFSTSGRFVSPYRNTLHPNILEALMCARDWLWADIHEHSPPT